LSVVRCRKSIEHRAWSIGKYSWQLAAGRKKSAVGDQKTEGYRGVGGWRSAHVRSADLRFRLEAIYILKAVGWRLEVGGNEVRRGDAARREGIKYSVDPPVQELISRNPLQNSPVL
jgi:hypothetical protein